MNILDILILGFLAINIILGWKRGLISQVLGLAGVIIAFIAASQFGAVFGSWVFRSLNLEKYVTKAIVTAAESKGVSDLLVGTLKDIVPDVTTALQNTLGYILLFFLVLGGVKLVALLLKSLNRIPVLGKLNAIGGIVFGFLKAILTILAVVWALNLLPFPGVMDLVESSLLAPALLKVAPGIYQSVFNPQQYTEAVEAINKLREALKSN